MRGPTVDHTYVPLAGTVDLATYRDHLLFNVIVLHPDRNHIVHFVRPPCPERWIRGQQKQDCGNQPSCVHGSPCERPLTHRGVAARRGPAPFWSATRLV